MNAAARCAGSNNEENFMLGASQRVGRPSTMTLALPHDASNYRRALKKSFSNFDDASASMPDKTAGFQ